MEERRPGLRWVQYCCFNRPLREQEKRYLKSVDAVILGYPATQQALVKELQSEGVKALAYASLYKAPDIPAVAESNNWETGSPAQSECRVNPFWQAVSCDSSSSWLAYDEDGKVRRPFESQDYAAGWNETTPFEPEYREACKRGVEELLSMGMDGVFIDNVRIDNRPAHAGRGDSQAVADAMRSLVMETIEHGRKIDPHALFITNGQRDPDVLSVVHAYTMESFLFSWAWDLSTFQAESWQRRWSRLRDLAWAPGRGAQPIAMAYLGFSGRSVREDAVTFVAVANLLGMGLSDGLTAGDRSMIYDFAKHNVFQGGTKRALAFLSEEKHSEWALALYKMNLGEPLGELMEQEGCILRRFENGICVFNPTGALKCLKISTAESRLYEHACGVFAEVRDGSASLWIAPFAGRLLTAAR